MRFTTYYWRAPASLVPYFVERGIEGPVRKYLRKRLREEGKEMPERAPVRRYQPHRSETVGFSGGGMNDSFPMTDDNPKWACLEVRPITCKSDSRS